MSLWGRGVSDSVRSLSWEIQAQGGVRLGESDRESATERDLLVEMFHRGGTENDEEADPERGPLEEIGRAHV